MNHKNRLGVTIRLERLEARDVPTGNLPWPVGGANPELLFTYGQFIETPGLHFHEGIDILEAKTRPVSSIEAAKWWDGTNVGNANDHVELTSGDHGWGYLHATAVAVPIMGNILQGQQIATVAPAPGMYPEHLHLNYTDNAADPSEGNYLRPKGNPLDYLTPNDTIAPTVDPNGFRFRTAETDWNGNLTPDDINNPTWWSEELPRYHQYFQNFAPLNMPYVGERAFTRDADANPGPGTTDIDVIANVYDQQKANGRKLAPYSVSFRIIGDSFSTQGDDTGWVTPFVFTGEFLNRQYLDPKGHNIAALRDLNMVRTVYEHDVPAQSREAGDSFFILTNYSGEVASPKVDYYSDDNPLNDRERSWQSNVSRSTARQWYDVLAEADRATVNADSQFRDGFYKLKVWGQDASGNFDIKETRFLLVNYTRPFTALGLTSTTVQIDPNPNYLASDAVPIYELTSAPQEGTVLTNQIRTIATNASGAMVTTTMNITANRWYVADYDHDGKYYSPLDAILAVHTQGGDRPGRPLLAASMGHNHTSATLTSQQVDAVSPEAIHRWKMSGADTSALAGIDLRIADLGGTTLGLASGRSIYLDDNAAGWGWFVDPTPHNDSEFTTRGNQGEKHRMDLLTVLEHELGHVLGLGHEETGVMIDVLPASTRRIPGSDLSLSDSAGADWLSAWTEWESSAIHKTRAHFAAL